MKHRAKELDDRFRKYAWDYFAVHAAQRLTGVQFFITLATAIVGGYFALIVNGGAQKWIAVLGVLLVVLSFVFYKLDARTRDLIKNAENALSYLDELQHVSIANGEPHPLQLIARDDYLCSTSRRRGFLRGRLSYTKCFNIVFFGFAILGLAAALHALFFLPLSIVGKQEHGSIISVNAKVVEQTGNRTLEVRRGR